MSEEPEYDSAVEPTTEPLHRDDRCHAPYTKNGVTVARCEHRKNHTGTHHTQQYGNWLDMGGATLANGESATFLHTVANPALGTVMDRERFGYRHEAAALAYGEGRICGVDLCVLDVGHDGEHRQRLVQVGVSVAEPAKSSPIDDIRAIHAASSTRPGPVTSTCPPQKLWAGAHPPPAGIVEACGCEESVSLAERVELLETLMADIAEASGVGPNITPEGLVERVQLLTTSMFNRVHHLPDRSDEIASLVRAVRAEREAALDATHKAARLTLHNRMLLGLVEVLAAPPPKPESSLARARSLWWQTVEITTIATGVAIVGAVVAVEAAGEKLSDALGWAAVGTY